MYYSEDDKCMSRRNRCKEYRWENERNYWEDDEWEDNENWFDRKDKCRDREKITAKKINGKTTEIVGKTKKIVLTEKMNAEIEDIIVKKINGKTEDIAVKINGKTKKIVLTEKINAEEDIAAKKIDVENIVAFMYVNVEDGASR